MLSGFCAASYFSPQSRWKLPAALLQLSKRPQRSEVTHSGRTAGLQTQVPPGTLQAPLSPVKKDRLEIPRCHGSGWDFTTPVKTPLNQKDLVDKFNQREAELRPNLLSPLPSSPSPLIAAGSVVVDFPRVK